MGALLTAMVGKAEDWGLAACTYSGWGPGVEVYMSRAGPGELAPGKPAALGVCGEAGGPNPAAAAAAAAAAW